MISVFKNSGTGDIDTWFRFLKLFQMYCANLVIFLAIQIKKHMPI